MGAGSGHRRNRTETVAARGGVRQVEPAARQLILERWWWLVLGPLVTLAMLVLSLAPYDLWPLSYACLVPWLIVVVATPRARRVYVMSYLLGLAFFCTSIYWLFMVTAAGSMVLFAIFAIHFPLVACPVRHMVRRRHWPLALALPVIWVGSEAVRSMIVLPFPWNLLGHSQHRLLPMIQISDLVGAYGVSFVLASLNGMIADLILCRRGWPTSEGVEGGRTSAKSSVVTACVLTLATLGYGAWQLSRDTMHDGPKVAVIQGNYPNYVDAARASREPTTRQRARRYLELLDESAKHRPDLFLLPETPWTMMLNKEFLEKENPAEYTGIQAYSRDCYAALAERAKVYKAVLVTGSMSIVPTPLSLLSAERRYNSAFVFSPDGTQTGRYDKMHLVLIGEYVPFRYGPLRPLYLWINRIGPFYDEKYEYSLNWGEEFTTFDMEVGGRTYGFATPICYENVMPYISRRFVTDPDGRKRCDFLLNLSNDGWFVHSAELPQHLAASVFRAVENRVGVARAVNTGISCFVDPDGRVHDVVSKDGRVVGPGVDGYRVAHVRVDDRHSLYSRWGDWFAVTCAVLWGLFYLDYTVVRWLAARRLHEEKS